MTPQEFVLTLSADRQAAIRCNAAGIIMSLWRTELVKLAAYGNKEAATELQRRTDKRKAKRISR